jgi:hypothetical protein
VTNPEQSGRRRLPLEVLVLGGCLPRVLPTTAGRHRRRRKRRGCWNRRDVDGCCPWTCPHHRGRRRRAGNLRVDVDPPPSPTVLDLWSDRVCLLTSPARSSCSDSPD